MKCKEPAESGACLCYAHISDAASTSRTRHRDTATDERAHPSLKMHLPRQGDLSAAKSVSGSVFECSQEAADGRSPPTRAEHIQNHQLLRLINGHLWLINERMLCVSARYKCLQSAALASFPIAASATATVDCAAHF